VISPLSRGAAYITALALAARQRHDGGGFGRPSFIHGEPPTAYSVGVSGGSGIRSFGRSGLLGNARGQWRTTCRRSHAKGRADSPYLGRKPAFTRKQFETVRDPIEDEISDGTTDARSAETKPARDAMLDRHDEATTDAAAKTFARSIGSNMPLDVKSKPIDRDFGADFNRHQAARLRLDKLHPPRPPVADVSGFKLNENTCLCCSKSFKTLHAKEFCSKVCTDKGPPLPPQRKSICEHCGDQFMPKRFNARFCSPTHQKASRRAELSRTTLAEAV
jgi:hypothetical protein